MKLALLLLALTIPALRAAPQAQPQPQQLAERAAAAWLAKLDAANYGDTWQDAAQIFKDHVTRKQWESAARATRAPLGALQSRKLKSATYKTSLPGAPDSEYVVLQYDSSFEHKQSAIETVTPTLDKDGAWRVSGYFIR